MSKTETAPDNLLDVDAYLDKFEKITCDHIPALYRQQESGYSRRHEITYRNRVVAQLRALEKALLNPQDKDKSDQARELVNKVNSLVHAHIRD